MFRSRTTLLLLLIGLLGAANLVLLAGRAVPAARGPESDHWQRWRALPTEQRLEVVRRYQELLRQTDVVAACRRARQFNDLDPARQKYLRELFTVMQQTLEQQPAARRREWLRAAPRARAFYVYQILASEQPARLAELSARRPA